MLTIDEGEFIVKLARKSIKKYLYEEKKPETTEVPDKLEESRGVFVTLIKDEGLRGCIGRPFPTQTLVQGVIDSSIDSAFGDPRFPPLQEKELGEIRIEVSVLTSPEVIEVENPGDYPEEVNVGEDGLIIEDSSGKGLLLPQVPVEQGWNSEEFLTQTCLKAHLKPDCWFRKDVKIKKFSAQVFSEKEPNGDIIERKVIEKA